VSTGLSNLASDKDKSWVVAKEVMEFWFPWQPAVCCVTTSGLTTGLCKVESLTTCQGSGVGCGSKQQSFRHLK